MFCGFRDLPDPKFDGLSEKAFASKVVHACSNGKVRDRQQKQGVGSDLSEINLDGEYVFKALKEWDDESVSTADFDLIAESDVILTVFPFRKDASGRKDSSGSTSLYSAVEAVAAYASKKPLFPVGEFGVDPKRIPILGDVIRFSDKIRRTNVADYAKNLKTGLDEKLAEGLLTREDIAVKNQEDVDNLYRILVDTILISKEIWIFNHSALAIGSQMDPFNIGKAGFTDYNDCMPPWIDTPHRSLYFEVEEALVTLTKAHDVQAWERAIRLLKCPDGKMFGDRSDDENKIDTRTRVGQAIETRRSSLKLNRAVSLVSEAEFEHLQKGMKKNAVLARYASLLIHLWRLQNLKRPVEYTLFVFPTSALQSAPTAIVAEIPRKGKRYPRGMWGLLRDPGSPRNRTDKDSLMITNNRPVVEMWKQSINKYFDTDTDGVKRVFKKTRPNLGGIFDIVGKRAIDDTLTFLKIVELKNRGGRQIPGWIPQQAFDWYDRELAIWTQKKQTHPSAEPS